MAGVQSYRVLDAVAPYVQTHTAELCPACCHRLENEDTGHMHLELDTLITLNEAAASQRKKTSACRERRLADTASDFRGKAWSLWARKRRGGSGCTSGYSLLDEF